MLATVFALAGILVYIAFRFRFSFAVGAVVATIHDLLITLAFLAFFRYDLSLNVIAALLTITGYSMNDTIVIFDRVRENMRCDAARQPRRRSSTPRSTRCSSRTMITAGLRCSRCIALFFFGGEVLQGFAFTMIVGIITGTYSSVFIAAAIVVIWQGRTPLKARAGAAPVAPRRQARGKPQPAPGVLSDSAVRDHAGSPPRCSGSCRGSPSSCRCLELRAPGPRARLLRLERRRPAFGLAFDVALHARHARRDPASLPATTSLAMIAAAPAALGAAAAPATRALIVDRHHPGRDRRRAVRRAGWRSTCGRRR